MAGNGAAGRIVATGPTKSLSAASGRRPATAPHAEVISSTASAAVRTVLCEVRVLLMGCTICA